jgi:hypothetical protein
MVLPPNRHVPTVREGHYGYWHLIQLGILINLDLPIERDVERTVRKGRTLYPNESVRSLVTV